MRVVYALTPELRDKFKEPFGTLLRGTFVETTKKLTAIVTAEKPSKLVSVGDKVSRTLHEHGVVPQLSVTDNRSLRRNVRPATFHRKRVVRVKNPPGTITDEAAAAVQKALESDEHVHVVVDGEEDLLTLIAVLHAPENALVVYGQPYVGVVAVRVTAEKRAQARALLDAMVVGKS